MLAPWPSVLTSPEGKSNSNSTTPPAGATPPNRSTRASTLGINNPNATVSNSLAASNTAAHTATHTATNMHTHDHTHS